MQMILLVKDQANCAKVAGFEPHKQNQRTKKAGSLEELLTQEEYEYQDRYQELEALARRGRWLAISTVAGSGAGHVGGPFSAMDIMMALYFRVMNIRPEEPRWPERDRFILSKGHSSIGQYAGDGAARISPRRRAQNL